MNSNQAKFTSIKVCEVPDSHVDFRVIFAGFYLHSKIQEHVNFASSYILKDLHSLPEYVSKN